MTYDVQDNKLNTSGTKMDIENSFIVCVNGEFFVAKPPFSATVRCISGIKYGDNTRISIVTLSDGRPAVCLNSMGGSIHSIVNYPFRPNCYTNITTGPNLNFQKYGDEIPKKISPW
jgi:hypothetical protein